MNSHVYESRYHSKYHGLINQGSTCYLNSVLQVLFMTKEFREAVESYEGDSESLDFHLKNLFKELKTSIASTKELTKVLGIKDFLQSDAAGCLENILSKMKSPGTSQLFQGTLTNKKICCICKNLTKTDDPFWSLPLGLGDYDGHPLDYFMKNYFMESVLSGADQLYCERCSTKTDTTIKVEMKDHPEVLTLLLKRFKFDNYYRGYVKVKCRVEVPDCLQIPNKSQSYQLYAYVEHYGELKCGHYVVTIKAQDDDEWYTFNDSYVSLLSDRKNCHINSTSYLLFYRKMPATDSLNADNSGAFTSQDFESDQPRRSNMELKEEHKDGEDQLMSTSGNPPEDGKLLKIGTIGTESTNVDSQHSKPLEQDASADLQSDTRNKQRQTERQEEKKDCGFRKEIEYRIYELVKHQINIPNITPKHDSDLKKSNMVAQNSSNVYNTTQGNRNDEQGQSNAGANLEKLLALESSGSIEALSSYLGRMRLSDSSDPNGIGNQRVSTKSET